MPPALIFVESNSTGTGRLMARAAAQLGFRPLVLASAPERYAYIEQDRLAARRVDTQDEEQVLAACRALAVDGGVAGVTSSSEYFVGMAAAVAERLGLPAPPAAAIRAFADKSTQRRLLTEGRVPVPAWRSAVSAPEAVAAAAELGWPVVLKPVAGSGSIGVKLCRDPREVAEHAAALVTRTTNERGIAVPPVLLVESLVEGPEYSVEVFSSRIAGITAKRLGPLPHFVEIGHDFPADLTGDARAAIEAATLAALRALRLEVGPAHVELRIGPDGPAIIEVNARLAGGFIPELVRLARGVDLLETNVRFAAGLPIALDATRDDHVAIRFLLPDGDGLLAEVQGLEAAARVPLVVEAVGYRALGEPVSRRGDFRDRIGHVMACGADRAAVLEAVEAAARQVSMHVTPVEASDPQQRPRAAPGKELAREESTGRIRRTLDSELARIVFGADADAAIDAELPFMTEVDRAHVVMLAEASLMAPDVAARLLGEIEVLRREGFASLRGRPAPRGLYLLYESHLVARLGPEVGGALHTGRSRNDLSATVLRLRLRRPVLELAGQLGRLIATLAERGRRFRELVMPIYTHFQAALPVSLGHYLAGVACALARDLDALVAAASGLDRCPLGAGAVGGTSLPIEPARTARLLGFAEPVPSSIDAVASRDLALRLVAAAAVLGVTLSRVAADLLLWTTAEFGFLQLPDELVGSSSMMPQKRNPFLLEHVAGRAGSPLGAFTAACTAMHGAPFSNSIAVGTEAMRPLWSTLRDTTEAVVLLRAVIEGMAPDEQAMARRAREGYICATRLAEWLVVRRGLPFRDAHHAVGELINQALAEGVPLPEIAARAFGDPALEAQLDPQEARRAARYGGGPGAELDATLAHAERAVASARSWQEAREHEWQQATRHLDAETDRCMAGAARP